MSEARFFLLLVSWYYNVPLSSDSSVLLPNSQFTLHKNVKGGDLTVSLYAAQTKLIRSSQERNSFIPYSNSQNV